MTSHDLEKHQYSAQQVAEASGLSNVLIQQYSDRGLLRFESIQTGTRTYRKFSYEEVLIAAVLSVLRNMELTPGAAMEYARAAVGQWLDSRGPDAMPHTEDIATSQFAILPEAISPHFASAGNQLAECIGTDVLRKSYLLGGKKTTFGTPCAFLVIDIAAIDQNVQVRLRSGEK